jgi:transcription factor TFIIIB component B''
VQPASDIEHAEPQVFEDVAAAPVKKKKATKRRKFQPAEEGDEDATATLAMQLNAPRRITRRGRKKKDANGNKRGATPEGAENEQINPSTMKMAELCKDIRIGVKSSNHDMIKQRVLEQKAKAKLAKASPATPPADNVEPAAHNLGLEALEGPTIPSGPQMRIVNGQIVLAESSLHLDRHKRAEAENEEMVEVEENEFSHMTTSGTYMKRERAQLWDSVATSTFYQGLGQFGTNFEMISKLFPSRSRRQIKLKFNSEERKNPVRINRILMGEPQRIDLANFEEMSGLKLEEVADIEKERQAIADEHEREVQAREKEKTDADLRKKKEIADRSASARKVLASVDEVEEGSSGKENRVAASGVGLAELMAGAEQSAASKGKGSKKAQPKARKKKNPHGRGDGGDVVEVLGSL